MPSARAGTWSEVTPRSSHPRELAEERLRKSGGGASDGTAFGRICVKENPATSKGGLLSVARKQEMKGREPRGEGMGTHTCSELPREARAGGRCVSPPRSPCPVAALAAGSHPPRDAHPAHAARMGRNNLSVLRSSQPDRG